MLRTVAESLRRSFLLPVITKEIIIMFRPVDEIRRELTDLAQERPVDAYSRCKEFIRERADALRGLIAVAEHEGRGLQASEQRTSEKLTDALEDLNRLSATLEPAAVDARREGIRGTLTTDLPAWDDDRPARGSYRSRRGERTQMSELEDRAHRTVDGAFGRGQLPDYAAERASRLLTEGRATERGIAAKWAVAAGNPDYLGAFAKLAADPERGHLLWSPAEHEAYRQVAAVQAEMESRTAMSLTVGNGGYMVPLTLDPAIILTNDGSINPLRGLATIKQTVTNTWQGVTSAGVTAEWKAEGDQVADASPTLAGPSIPVFLGDAYVIYSFEVGMDARDLVGELVPVLTDGAAQLQATAFTTGNGTTAPQGIVTGLAGTSSEINTLGSEAHAATDPYALQNALPARWSGNATWQSHIATKNVYQQFETSNGSWVFDELRQNPPMLLSKPWFENSNMDGTINAAATANNYALIYGDVKAGFYIVDRIGTTLEFIPNVVGANFRPTGQRGALLWFRTGSEVVIPGAMRLLDIPTTA